MDDDDTGDVGVTDSPVVVFGDLGCKVTCVLYGVAVVVGVLYGVDVVIGALSCVAVVIGVLYGVDVVIGALYGVAVVIGSVAVCGTKCIEIILEGNIEFSTVARPFPDR